MPISSNKTVTYKKKIIFQVTKTAQTKTDSSQTVSLAQIALFCIIIENTTSPCIFLILNNASCLLTGIFKSSCTRIDQRSNRIL